MKAEKKRLKIEKPIRRKQIMRFKPGRAWRTRLVTMVVKNPIAARIEGMRSRYGRKENRIFIFMTIQLSW